MVGWRVGRNAALVASRRGCCRIRCWWKVGWGRECGWVGGSERGGGRRAIAIQLEEPEVGWGGGTVRCAYDALAEIGTFGVSRRGVFRNVATEVGLGGVMVSTEK